MIRQKCAFDSFQIGDVPAAREPFRLLNRVPILENGEPLVDLRVTNPELSFGDYCLPYVRQRVAEALNEATDRLPSHLDLRIYTALRTLDQQSEMYWHNYKKAKEEHPNWPESVVRRMTNRFFAPPDSKAPPGHCTGGAVDVGLLDRETGEGIDVRSPIEGWKGAPTAVVGLSAAAAENRRLLCYLMHSTGLSNCRDEFWHWSYGDSAWAVRVGAPTACYGLTEPPADHTRVQGGKLAVVPFNPEWAEHFATIRVGLAAALGRLAVSIEHVGSTAVPGLAAKPVLDIDVVIESRDVLSKAVLALEELGFTHEGDLGVEGREAFRAKDGDAPCKGWHPHHLYVCARDNAELARHIAFRDFLRANNSAADAYAALKTSLAARHPWDRIRYNDGKTKFVEELLAQSMEWRKAFEQRP